jgi:hypothetical protein
MKHLHLLFLALMLAIIPRVAPALAEVGWILLAPPSHNHRVDSDAPFADWSAVGRFGSLAECHDRQRVLIETLGGGMWAEGSDYIQRDPTEDGHKKKPLDASFCIRTDDPRLGGN